MDGFITAQLAAVTASLRALLPRQQCRYCRGRCDDRSSLCTSCSQLLLQRRYRCQRCALPLAAEEASLCGECLVNPPPFNRSITAFDYEAPVSNWVNNFKHQRDLRDGHLLSGFLARAIRSGYRDEPLPQLLVPVPLHWHRQLRRSFNQTAWISHCLGQELRLPATNLLRRHRKSHSQQGLNREQRQRNLRGSFKLVSGSTPLQKLRHVALVDDVVTTTATARELTLLLLAAGATRVDVWCLARTPRQQTGLDPLPAMMHNDKLSNC